MIAPFSYAPTPAGYECSRCHAKGVKLWRPLETSSAGVRLLCLACGMKDQGLRGYHPTRDGQSLYTGKIEHWYRADDSPYDEEGKAIWCKWSGKKGEEPTGEGLQFCSNKETGHLGTLRPAVPTEDGQAFCGFTAAETPEAGQAWWFRLPCVAP